MARRGGKPGRGGGIGGAGSGGINPAMKAMADARDQKARELIDAMGKLTAALTGGKATGANGGSTGAGGRSPSLREQQFGSSAQQYGPFIPKDMQRATRSADEAARAAAQATGFGGAPGSAVSDLLGKAGPMASGAAAGLALGVAYKGFGLAVGKNAAGQAGAAGAALWQNPETERTQATRRYVADTTDSFNTVFGTATGTGWVPGKGLKPLADANREITETRRRWETEYRTVSLPRERRTSFVNEAFGGYAEAGGNIDSKEFTAMMRQTMQFEHDRAHRMALLLNKTDAMSRDMDGTKPLTAGTQGGTSLR